MNKIEMSLDEFVKNAATHFYNDEIMTYPTEQWKIKFSLSQELAFKNNELTAKLEEVKNYDNELYSDLEEKIAAANFEWGQNMFVLGALYAFKMATEDIPTNN